MIEVGRGGVVWEEGTQPMLWNFHNLPPGEPCSTEPRWLYLYLYLLCIHQIHTRLDIELVTDYIELKLQNRK